MSYHSLFLNQSFILHHLLKLAVSLFFEFFQELLLSLKHLALSRVEAPKNGRLFQLIKEGVIPLISWGRGVEIHQISFGIHRYFPEKH